MKVWNIGTLGAASVASQRFLPALAKCGRMRFVGAASRDMDRCRAFVQPWGGRCYPDYEALLSDPDVECVYLPLPPALHAEWGRKVLEAGKHLLMEKPFTVSAASTRELLDLAEASGLAVHENYMFLYHRQLTEIRNIVNSGRLGALRMIRAAFTFPFRGAEDFRYQPELGGGALLDCGGYPILLASELLGESAEICWAGLRTDPVYHVETGGSAVLQNRDGLTAHVFFGMDDTYRCSLEIWGSRASLETNRVFTAPPNLTVRLDLTGGEAIEVSPDDAFLASINRFADLMDQPDAQAEERRRILRQAELVDRVRSFMTGEPSK